MARRHDSGTARPARSGRVLIAALMTAGVALPAMPAQGQDREMETCLAIPDVGQRVACYDAVARSRSAPGSRSPATPPAAATPMPVPEARDPSRDFGLSEARRETQRPAEERVPDSITTVVASSRLVGAGYWELVMTDNSVWRFTEVRTAFRSPRAGEEVRIRQGAVGSYHLQLSSQPTVRAVRVR